MIRQFVSTDSSGFFSTLLFSPAFGLCVCVTLFLSGHGREGGTNVMKHWEEAILRHILFLTEREDILENPQKSISKNLALGGCVAALPLAARDSHGSKPCDVL